MGEIASKEQLRASFLRWAIVAVPLIVLLGTLSGMAAGSSMNNYWFSQLHKPAIMPPGWAFGVAWTILYILMGLAVSHVLNARRAAGKACALCLFALQLVMNLGWSPLFFRLHRVVEAFWLIIALLLVSAIATIAMARVRRVAGWLMIPYLLWLCYAATLNWQIIRLNPDVGNAGVFDFRLG